MIAYGVWHMSRYVIPPTSNKVDQSSLEYHEKAAGGTFNEELAKGSAPLPHAH
jgi:hypothetical protein